jgi:hypothetical protein
MARRCFRWVSATVWLIWLAALALSSVARAQAPLMVPERVSQIIVTPAVADAGVAREIKITGTWPGCVPVGATLPAVRSVPPTALVVRLILPQTFAPCAAFLPYTVTATYTPESRGITKLLVLNVDGEYLGEGLLDTRAPGDNHSALNITGMWYDPQSNGSGLTFVHSRVNDNAVFGTWYVYDGSGKPLWYTIQDAVWKSQGRVMEGWLYQTSAVANCPLPFIYGCPASIGLLAVVGRARVTITGNGTATVEALTTGGTVIFSSNVIRAEI